MARGRQDVGTVARAARVDVGPLRPRRTSLAAGGELLGRHRREPGDGVHVATDGVQGRGSDHPPTDGIDRRSHLVPWIALSLSTATRRDARDRLDEGVSVTAIVWILIVVAIVVIVAIVVLVMRARSRGRMIISRRGSSRRTGGSP